MITPSQALNLIQLHSTPIATSETLPLEKCIGRILSTDVVTPVHLPPFAQAVMDGYAVHLHDVDHYTIVGEVKAGDAYHPALQPGEAVRIFTGAAVPATANAVVMQEKTERQGVKLILNDVVNEGDYIRTVGEQLRQGDTALVKGTLINEATVALLAGMGLTETQVFTLPRIAVVVTGNEIVEPGRTLEYGQVYNSNGPMLTAALKQLGWTDVSVYHVKDDLTETQTLFRNLKTSFQIILISGGISVGEYDHVAEALEAIGVKKVFHKIAQKPGKPIYFGTADGTSYFGLPGNPASSLTCFYVYVLPALRRIGGVPNPSVRIRTPLATQISNNTNLSQFLKGEMGVNGVSSTDKQQSSMIVSLSHSQCLICIPPGPVTIPSGELVEIIPLPGRL